jgi:hypothetical protein
MNQFYILHINDKHVVCRRKSSDAGIGGGFLLLLSNINILMKVTDFQSKEVTEASHVMTFIKRMN